MKKRMLMPTTTRYQCLPKWLSILLLCLMVLVFHVLGSLIFGGIVGFLSGVLHLSVQISFIDVVVDSLHFHLLSTIGVIAIVFVWVKQFEKRSPRNLGLCKQDYLFEIFKGWGVGVVIYSMSFLLTYLFGGVELKGVDFSISTILYVLSTIPVWFIQGGTEELTTRGWLLPILYQRTNLSVAIGVSSSLFGLLHLGNPNVTAFSVLSIILSGVFMALYMLKTDNLWGVAGLHGAWNFTQGNIYGVAVSGLETGPSLLHFEMKTDVADWISGGDFGTEGSLLTSFVLLIGICFLVWQLKKEK